MKLIDKSAVEKILRELWIEDRNGNPEHRICYNKALQEVQCNLDTIEVKEEIPKFKIGQHIKQGDTIAEIKEISEDGYHCDIAFVPFTAEENWKLSLWSEEDDKLLYECKKEMWKSAPTMLSLKHEKIEKWLESLKQRFKTMEGK